MAFFSGSFKFKLVENPSSSTVDVVQVVDDIKLFSAKLFDHITLTLKEEQDICESRSLYKTNSFQSSSDLFGEYFTNGSKINTNTLMSNSKIHSFYEHVFSI